MKTSHRFMLLGYQTGKKCQPEGGLTAQELNSPSASPLRGETSQRVMGGKTWPTKKMDLHHFQVIPVKRCGQEISKTCVFCCVLSHVQLFLTPWTVAHLAPLSRNSPGKNTGVSCHFLLQGDLPNLGVKPTSSVSPALAGRVFTIASPGKPCSQTAREVLRETVSFKQRPKMEAGSKEELKILFMMMKEGSEESSLKLNIQEHGIQSHHFMANRWGNNGNSDRIYFIGLPNHCGQ